LTTIIYKLAALSVDNTVHRRHRRSLIEVIYTNEISMGTPRGHTTDMTRGGGVKGVEERQVIMLQLTMIML
jgi:hypothetical protein